MKGIFKTCARVGGTRPFGYHLTVRTISCNLECRSRCLRLCVVAFAICILSRIGMGVVPIETVTFPGLLVPVPDRGGLGAKCMKNGAVDMFFLA